MQIKQILRYQLVYILLAVLLVVAVILNINTGNIHISPARIFRIIFLKGDMGTPEYNIIWKIRLPRLCMAAILGGALSLSGFLLQTFFRNPIAGPFVLGISSGAKMFVAITMIFLLKYVSGLNAGVAQQIVLYRNEFGKFNNRQEIKKVKKLGEKTYTQAIGFLRILDGNQPLDATAIHPENYQQALALLQSCHLSLNDLGTDALKEKILKINKKEVIETLKIDQYTLDDIIDCLIKPNRSIRDQYQTPLLKKDILHIEDLKPGMVLEGTIRNVVDFGAFIDIGLKNDGLVHISKMSKQRIKHPLDVLSIGDIVEVNVIDVDLKKNRVSLSMI